MSKGHNKSVNHLGNSPKRIISEAERKMQDSGLILGDGLDQPYQRVLKNMKGKKAEKNYTAPDDDIIEIGSARPQSSRKDTKGG